MNSVAIPQHIWRVSNHHETSGVKSTLHAGFYILFKPLKRIEAAGIVRNPAAIVSTAVVRHQYWVQHQ
jgi:hypothetical protein